MNMDVSTKYRNHIHFVPPIWSDLPDPLFGCSGHPNPTAFGHVVHEESGLFCIFQGLWAERERCSWRWRRKGVNWEGLECTSKR